MASKFPKVNVLVTFDVSTRVEQLEYHCAKEHESAVVGTGCRHRTPDDYLNWLARWKCFEGKGNSKNRFGYRRIASVEMANV